MTHPTPCPMPTKSSLATLWVLVVVRVVVQRPHPTPPGSHEGPIRIQELAPEVGFEPTTLRLTAGEQVRSLRFRRGSPEHGIRDPESVGVHLRPPNAGGVAVLFRAVVRRDDPDDQVPKITAAPMTHSKVDCPRCPIRAPSKRPPPGPFFSSSEPAKKLLGCGKVGAGIRLADW
jgi:hypothetical protein